MSVVISRPAHARPAASCPDRPVADVMSLLSRPWLAPVVLVLLFGFQFVYGLTAGSLYRTESLRAILAAEMLRSGDWVVPRLYGEPLLTKPPGMYAAIALVSLPFGEVTDWSARLPSVLAGTVTVLLFYWHFRRTFGPLGGLLAALALPTTILWLDKAPSAEIDLLQVAWVAAAIVFFLRALELEEDRLLLSPQGRMRSPLAPWTWWLAALLCVAGGVLTKWTAPAFFYGTAIPLLLWRRRLGLLFGWRHLTAAALGAGLCFAWAGLAIRHVGWDIFYATVSREALMRLSPAHHHRPYPWREVLAHPFLMLGATLPWSACLLWASRPSFAALWDDAGRRLLQALHCWMWPNLLFWTIIPDHAARHAMPLCTGLAGLAAMVWLAWLTGRLRWPLAGVRPGVVLTGFLVLWVLVKVAYVHAVMPARTGTREPRAKAAVLREAVPPGQTLYLFRLKDEGIMFYFGRPVRRLAGPEQLPSSGEPLYGILTQADWDAWPLGRPREAIARLTDEQGDPMILVRLPPPQAPDGTTRHRNAPP